LWSRCRPTRSESRACSRASMYPAQREKPPSRGAFRGLLPICRDVNTAATQNNEARRKAFHHSRLNPILSNEIIVRGVGIPRPAKIYLGDAPLALRSFRHRWNIGAA
jgi:hypothetical protein